MSLFKARDWWETWCGSANEEFDIGCLQVANIDNNSNGFDKIIVGSFHGVLRIYSPQGGGFRPDSLMLEVQLNAPIIQVAVGRFVSGTENLNLAVLHSKRLVVYSVAYSHSEQQHSSCFNLIKMYEHNIDRVSANMCSGPFGSIAGKDFICVQSMDGLLTFFEQEIFSAKISLPNFMLPSAMIYAEKTDSFVTISSLRQIESFKYQSLAVGDNLKTKKPTADWTKFLGDHALDIKYVDYGEPQILVLGERSLICLTATGDIQFINKFEFNPSSFIPFGPAENGTSRILVSTHTNTLLVYAGITLIWAAQLPHIPVATRVAKFSELSGVTVTLDEYGHLYCSYLGTDPSLFITPSVDAREANNEEIDREMKELQKIIRESQVTSDVSVGAEKKEEITLRAEVPKDIDKESVSPETMTDENTGEDVPFPSATIKLIIQVDTIKPIERVTITASSQFPIYANRPNFVLPIVGDKGPIMEIDVGFFMVSGGIPTSLQGTFMATYVNNEDSPKVAQCSFELPFRIVCFGCPPIKVAKYKLTLDTNKEPVNLAELFPDMVDDAIIPIPAIGFRFVGGGPIVSILSSKSNNRYRIQSDSFEMMWLVIDQLVKRLEQHFKKAKEGTQFKAGFAGPLPLAEYGEVIDAHFEHRQNLDQVKALLDHRAHQFRVIQKRLLTRFKDKTPSPLNHIDVLLDGTYKQLLALGEKYEQVQVALHHSGNSLAMATKLFIFLIKLWNQLTPDQFKVLEDSLTPCVPDSLEQGWEEIVDNNITHLLRTCLAKSTKDQNVSLQPLKMPENTSKLKKHIALMCERLNKGGKLSLDASAMVLSPSHEALSRTDLETVGEEENGEEDESMDGLAKQVGSMNVHSRSLDKMSLDKRMHLPQDSVEAEAVRSAVQRTKKKQALEPLKDGGSAVGESFDAE